MKLRHALLLFLLAPACGTVPRSPRIDGEPVLQLDPAVLRPQGRRQHVGAPVHVAGGFRECLFSWNVSGAGGDFERTGVGAWLELRVAREGQGWSPWLHVGEWNTARPAEARRDLEDAKIDVDVFVAERPYDRVQGRVTLAPDATGRLEVRLLAFAFDRPQEGRPTPPAARAVCLEVPVRSQRLQPEALSARVCSPTSVAMVLAYYGREVDVPAVADALYDREHDLYGNWPRATQFAHLGGLRAYLGRFDSWEPVEARVSRGNPVVISIAFGPGELTGAPLETTRGHLLVVRGFDAEGNVIVNDPAAPQLDTVRRTYDRHELGRAWWSHGGTAYLFEQP